MDCLYSDQGLRLICLPLELVVLSHKETCDRYLIYTYMHRPQSIITYIKGNNNSCCDPTHPLYGHDSQLLVYIHNMYLCLEYDAIVGYLCS